MVVHKYSNHALSHANWRQPKFNTSIRDFKRNYLCDLIKSYYLCQHRIFNCPNQNITNQTKYHYKGHNSLILQPWRPKFCMIVHIDSTLTLCHVKPNHTIPYQIKYPYIGYISDISKLEAPNSVLLIIIYIEHNTHTLYHKKLNQTKPNLYFTWLTRRVPDSSRLVLNKIFLSVWNCSIILKII